MCMMLSLGMGLEIGDTRSAGDTRNIYYKDHNLERFWTFGN